MTILAMGAGAAPALAVQQTPLVRAIQKVQDSLDLTLNENLQTAAGDHQEIQALIANAYALDQATNLVARIPAISSQQASKAEWLSGERLRVRLDVQTADAVFPILTGHATTGYRELQALNPELNRSNHLQAQADEALGIH